MVWHGIAKSKIDKAVLTDDQWFIMIKLAEDSEYWKTADKFMKSIEGRWLGSLTKKQVDWYYSIDATLDVEINRREARIAFGYEEEEEIEDDNE